MLIKRQRTVYAQYTVAVCGILQSQYIDEWMKNACDFSFQPKSIPFFSLLLSFRSCVCVWMWVSVFCLFYSIFLVFFWFELNGTLLPHDYSTKSRLLDCNGPDQSSCIEPDQEQWRITVTKLFNDKKNKLLPGKPFLSSIYKHVFVQMIFHC